MNRPTLTKTTTNVEHISFINDIIITPELLIIDLLAIWSGRERSASAAWCKVSGGASSVNASMYIG